MRSMYRSSQSELLPLHAYQELEHWRTQEQYARHQADEYRSQVPAPFCLRLALPTLQSAPLLFK